MILQGNEEKGYHIYYEYDRFSAPVGQNGMGLVYKGRMVDASTGAFRDVAITDVQLEGTLDEQSETIERAKRVSSIRVNNDNLVEILGFVEIEENKFNVNKKRYYIISEYLNGVSLDNVLNGNYYNYCGELVDYASELGQKYQTDRDAISCYIIKNVLSAFMALHDLGYIHRDLDPSKIMITDDRKIKLIDFGACEQIISLDNLCNGKSEGVFTGNASYAAPELLLGDIKNQNYTTDIYALGVLLYQLCCNHLPFHGTNQEIISTHLRGQIPMKDVKNNEFKRIIKKATNKMQSKRYASVSEFRVDLERMTNQIKIDNNTKKNVILIVLPILLCSFLFIKIAPLFKKNDVIPVVNIPTEPTNEELFDNALYLLSLKDDLYSQMKGKEDLKKLAVEIGYEPAKLEYYMIQIYSKNDNDVHEGFDGLIALTVTDSLNSSAIFECGLTLSKSNRYFNIPEVRQTALNIKADLEKANEYLYRSMAIDTTDYKSVYWAFNNMMELKIENALPDKDDKEIVRLLGLFENRLKNHSDTLAALYEEAIQSDKETLKVWGLLR